QRRGTRSNSPFGVIRIPVILTAVVWPRYDVACASASEFGEFRNAGSRIHELKASRHFSDHQHSLRIVGGKWNEPPRFRPDLDSLPSPTQADRAGESAGGL